MTDESTSLREHLVKLLRGGQAYETFEQIVVQVPAGKRGAVPVGAERSAWQILEHMRLSQRDILDFSRNENGTYVEKEWPAEYWPENPIPPTGGWDRAVQQYLADRTELEVLVSDPGRSLFTVFPWGKGQTLLREAMLAAEHAAYHLGELVILTRVL